MDKRIVSALVAVLLAFAALVLSTSPVQARGTSTYYSSCTRLHVRFAHGVAKSRAAALYQVRQGYGLPAYGTYARQVYWRNYTRLDRDRDGTACEK